jgi:filamentous hemagglutinin
LSFLIKHLFQYLKIRRFNRKSLLLFTALESYILISRIRAINFCHIGANVIRSVLIISLSFWSPISIANSYAGNLPIAVDGSTNTQIDLAANGVPIVNIAAPNSGGLSHNKFNSYNVNPSGLVINNATNNPNQVIQTQIGGLITDNPNLAGSVSARVILNEVTSTNRSILNGFTEIGGRQADLIIANPNGIEMNSAGIYQC